jgi:hypothetical protein
MKFSVVNVLSYGIYRVVIWQRSRGLYFEKQHKKMLRFIQRLRSSIIRDYERTHNCHNHAHAYDI